MTAPESGEDLRSVVQARVGTVLNDKWTLEKLLGTGGMGAVYEARHRNGARAAVKVLHPLYAREPAVRERFLREGYAANKVEHSGAVKVLDDDVVTSGPDEGTAYLVMELLKGDSLQDRIAEERPVSEREFLMVASSVLRVLEKAHANGVLHRDLKPENIFILADEPDPDAEPEAPRESLQIGRPRVKVLDFGLARVLDAQSSTASGLALGTPSFMSPEQASGDNADLDGRTDLFSLGATGFTVVGGRRVHEGAPHPVVQVANMATLPAPKIKNVAPHVSLPFARVIDRALAFKREDRYADAAEMRADVEKALIEIDEIARNPTVHDIPSVPELPDVPAPPASQPVAVAPASPDSPLAAPPLAEPSATYAVTEAATLKLEAVEKPASASSPEAPAGTSGEVETTSGATDAEPPAPANAAFPWTKAALAVAGMAGLAVALTYGLRGSAVDGAAPALEAAAPIASESASATSANAEAADAMPADAAPGEVDGGASGDDAAAAEVVFELEGGPPPAPPVVRPKPKPSGASTTKPAPKPTTKPPPKPTAKPPPRK